MKKIKTNDVITLKIMIMIVLVAIGVLSYVLLNMKYASTSAIAGALLMIITLPKSKRKKEE